MFLSGGVYISGILALISCICFAIFDILSIIQIAMITSREKVVLKYKSIVIIKLTFAVIAGNTTNISNILSEYRIHTPIHK